MGDMSDFTNSTLTFSRAIRTKHTASNADRHCKNVSCPKCDEKMVLKNGQYGKFFGCSTFPRCNGHRGII